MSDCLWSRFGTDFSAKPWMQGQTPGVKWAYFELVQHVRSHCPSQKKPGRASSMPVVMASRVWEVSVDEVELMLKLASEAGDLIVTETTWEVTDKTHFVSQRTIDSAKSAEPSHVLQDSADFAEKDATLYRTDTVTVTSTKNKNTNTPPTPQGGEGSSKKKRDPARKWGQVFEELKELLPESHHASVKDWCVYAKEKKYSAWVPETVKRNAKDWKEWSSERLAAMIDYTIRQSWQGLQEPKSSAYAKPGHQNGKATEKMDWTEEDLDRINNPWKYENEGQN